MIMGIDAHKYEIRRPKLNKLKLLTSVFIFTNTFAKNGSQLFLKNNRIHLYQTRQ